MTTAIAPYVSAQTPDLASFITNAVNTYPSGYTFTLQDFVNIITNYVNSNKQIFLELSTVRPDFEAIKQQFVANLSTRDAWKDIITASGGGTIIDFISSIGTYGQDGIVVALQESNLDTASLTSSVILLMRMLGVQIQRKTPASIDVAITSAYGSSIVIPSFTQFVVSGVNCFNRTAIIFESGQTTVNTTLYQGTVNNYVILSNGYPFQRLEIGNNDYTVSNNDIYCYQPDGTQYLGVTDGLWKYAQTDLIFYSNATPEGNVEIIFGNNLYGAIPPVNTVLAFVYATTNGSASNTSSSGNYGNIISFNPYVPDRINLDSDTQTNQYQAKLIASLTLNSTSGFYSGDDEKSIDFYRAVGPFLGTGKKGTIRKSEHYAVGLKFPGVIDILFRNQKDIMPYNRNLINIVQVTPLMTNGIPITPEVWQDFTDYMLVNQIWRVEFVLFQPRAIPLDITATLYCTLDSSETNVAIYAEYAVRQAYGLRRGSLGSSFYLSDLASYLKLDYQNISVDYSEITSPVADIIINPTDYLYINSLNLNVQFTTRNYPSYTPRSPESYIPLG